MRFQSFEIRWDSSHGTAKGPILVSGSIYPLKECVLCSCWVCCSTCLRANSTDQMLTILPDYFCLISPLTKRTDHCALTLWWLQPLCRSGQEHPQVVSRRLAGSEGQRGTEREGGKLTEQPLPSVAHNDYLAYLKERKESSVWVNFLLLLPSWSPEGQN